MLKIKMFLGTSILLLVSAQAGAAIITSQVFSQFEKVSSDRQTVQSLLLPYFDSSLGTLDSYTLIHTAFVQGSLILDNDSPDPLTISSPTYEPLYYLNGLTLQSGLYLDAPISGYGGFYEPGFTFTLDGDDGDGTGRRNGGLDEWDGQIGTGIGTQNDSDYLTKAFFIRDGGGYFEDGCRFNTDVNLRDENGRHIPSDSIELYEDTSAACGVHIEYHYTPAAVPEPAAILLFGIGLIGLIGFSKRRKAA